MKSPCAKKTTVPAINELLAIMPQPQSFVDDHHPVVVGMIHYMEHLTEVYLKMKKSSRSYEDPEVEMDIHFPSNTIGRSNEEKFVKEFFSLDYQLQFIEECITAATSHDEISSLEKYIQKTTSLNTKYISDFEEVLSKLGTKKKVLSKLKTKEMPASTRATESGTIPESKHQPVDNKAKLINIISQILTRNENFWQQKTTKPRFSCSLFCTPAPQVGELPQTIKELRKVKPAELTLVRIKTIMDNLSFWNRATRDPFTQRFYDLLNKVCNLSEYQLSTRLDFLIADFKQLLGEIPMPKDSYEHHDVGISRPF